MWKYLLSQLAFVLIIYLEYFLPRKILGIFLVITKPHNFSTYQNRPIIPDNNQGSARVTAAGAASPDAAGADVARLDNERETERAYRIRYHLEVHVA